MINYVLTADKWQLDWLEDMLLKFGEYREAPDGSIIKRLHYVRYNSCIHVTIYEDELWKRFCNNSRLY